MTIFDFHKRFPTKKSAIDFIIKVKYNGTYVCTFCGCVHNYIIIMERIRRNYWDKIVNLHYGKESNSINRI